jgi:uncharacterized membrane protein (UPF0127 family)
MATSDPSRFDGLPRRSLRDGRTLIEARTHRARRRGLARMDALDGDEALLIPQTPSIHTFGMRFALDLIWLDRRGAVVRVDRNVGPWRMRLCARAKAVIETNAGQADAFLAAGAAER